MYFRPLAVVWMVPVSGGMPGALPSLSTGSVFPGVAALAAVGELAEVGELAAGVGTLCDELGRATVAFAAGPFVLSLLDEPLPQATSAAALAAIIM
jgi:hypothetical protein